MEIYHLYELPQVFSVNLFSAPAKRRKFESKLKLCFLGSTEARVEGDSAAYTDVDGYNGNERICFNVGRELYVFVYR